MATEVKKIYDEEGNWNLCECEVDGTRVVKVLGFLKAGEKRMYTITITPIKPFHPEERTEIQLNLSDNEVCQLIEDLYEAIAYNAFEVVGEGAA